MHESYHSQNMQQQYRTEINNNVARHTMMMNDDVVGVRRRQEKRKKKTVEVGTYQYQTMELESHRALHFPQEQPS